MSVALFACPTPTILPEVSNPDCLASYGNVYAIAVQLVQDTPSFDETDIALKATWTPLLAAATDEAIRIIPVVSFATTPGEPIVEGGNDQTTRRGREKLKGVGFTKMAAIATGIEPVLAAELAALTKFSTLSNQRSNLRAYFLTEDDYILSALDFGGIEIWNFIVADTAMGGSFKPETSYGLSCGMDYQWSIEMVATKAAFDVLSLVNA